MSRITDAQVEVAFDAYWAVVALEGDESRKAMRAALEAYERVRDLVAIYHNARSAQQQAENDFRVAQALDDVRKRKGNQP